ncbi:MAG: hypothetical protein LW716_17155 [Microcystis sp. 53602_E8]|nr:hypothetical protein [Microcystis sp. 53602_E8]
MAQLGLYIAVRSVESSRSLPKSKDRTGTRSSAGLKILVRAVRGMKELSRRLTGQRETLTITGLTVGIVDGFKDGLVRMNSIAK